MEDSFVPPRFEVPHAYAWSEFHLEPLGEQHNDRDHAAWMSSIDHIRSTPGFSPQEEPNWPVAMTLEENLEDLVRHAKDFHERRGFTYSILEGDDVIGCIYIYPGRLPGHDAEISSWVRESRAELDTAVREALAMWIDEAWPFSNPFYAGRPKAPITGMPSDTCRSVRPTTRVSWHRIRRSERPRSVSMPPPSCGTWAPPAH
jgi:hypothetical protein